LKNDTVGHNGLGMGQIPRSTERISSVIINFAAVHILMAQLLIRSCRHWLRHYQQQLVVMATDRCSQPSMATGRLQTLYGTGMSLKQVRRLQCEHFICIQRSHQFIQILNISSHNIMFRGWRVK